MAHSSEAWKANLYRRVPKDFNGEDVSTNLDSLPSEEAVTVLWAEVERLRGVVADQLGALGQEIERSTPGYAEQRAEAFEAELTAAAEREAVLRAELDQCRADARGLLNALEAERCNYATWQERAEKAEAAIADVRRLCNLTIAASCRVQAIAQAHDTLAVLDRALGAPPAPADAPKEETDER